MTPIPGKTLPTIIYWLIDIRPETIATGWCSGKPFYCGKTYRTAKQRLREHKSDARRRPNREHSKLVLECGEYVAIQVIEIVPPDGSWITRERYWIAHLRASFPGITNISDGGEGNGDGRPPYGVGEDALKPILVHLTVEQLGWADKIGPNRATVIRTALEAYKKSLEDKAKRSKD